MSMDWLIDLALTIYMFTLVITLVLNALSHLFVRAVPKEIDDISLGVESFTWADITPYWFQCMYLYAIQCTVHEVAKLLIATSGHSYIARVMPIGLIFFDIRVADQLFVKTLKNAKTIQKLSSPEVSAALDELHDRLRHGELPRSDFIDTQSYLKHIRDAKKR